MPMTIGLSVSAAACSDGREPQAARPAPSTAAREAARTVRRVVPGFRKVRAVMGPSTVRRGKHTAIVCVMMMSVTFHMCQARQDNLVQALKSRLALVQSVAAG